MWIHYMLLLSANSVVPISVLVHLAKKGDSERRIAHPLTVESPDNWLHNFSKHSPVPAPRIHSSHGSPRALCHKYRLVHSLFQLYAVSS